MSDSLARIVRARAGNRCEYCRLPSSHALIPFELDHIIPVQHGGSHSLGNRALACFHCNRNKGPNLSGMDRLTSARTPVRLFHPRLHRWQTHFRLEGARIAGRTPVGRATIAVLKMNDPDLLELRFELLDEGIDLLGL